MLTLKKTILNTIIVTSLTLISTDNVFASTIDIKTEIKEAKTISKIFVTSLKAELKKAMVSGGPIKAIEVCNTKAIPITQKIAKSHNIQLSRVSLKNRNPDNKPNDWQQSILKSFDSRAAKRENIKTIMFSEIAEHNGKKQFRFMKAIPTGDGCLVCHGTNIAPIVQEKLATLYPKDKAIGYEKGQIRGAIVITKELN